MKTGNGKINKLLLATEGLGTVFIGLSLTVYLGGLPSTAVLHSEPIFRIPLAIFGAAFLALVICTAFLAVAFKRKNQGIQI